jgi:hypothetical protein
MRTTVAIDDNLLAAAKQAAHARHRTLGEFIEESLRVNLLRPLPTQLEAQETIKALPVLRAGLAPGVTMDDVHRLAYGDDEPDENGLYH